MSARTAAVRSSRESIAADGAHEILMSRRPHVLSFSQPRPQPRFLRADGRRNGDECADERAGAYEERETAADQEVFGSLVGHLWSLLPGLAKGLALSPV